MGSADTQPVCVSKERFTHMHTRDDDNEKGRAQCGPDLNAHQLHRDYAFIQLGSAHSCLPSASLQRTLHIPLFRNGTDTRQQAVQGRSDAEAVSQQRRNENTGLPQAATLRAQEARCSKYREQCKKRQIFKESELHRRNVRVRNEQAITEVYFGLFSIVRGKAALTCTVLNLKAPYYSKESDAKEHKPNGGAYQTGLVLPERGINTFQH